MSEPTIVGRYAIYDRIASGGMATVHFGRLLGQVGFARTVAIKRLHPHFAADPEFVAMFLDEARLAARISHPNVVSTLDVVAREGELFLVMEYVHGESLSGLMRGARERGLRLPTPVVVSIGSGILHGLHAAHIAASDHGEPLHIVHRDMSPQNVLVGSDGMPRVLDFGIAKALGQSHITREGQVKGKLAYMALEQVTGGQVTPQTDIFAASVVLWEALTAQRLFAADNDVALVQQLRFKQVDPPSRYADVPPALDAVLLRGLEREPPDRWQTAADMAAAMEDAVNPASPRKVAEWVHSLASHTLEERARRVSEIESKSTPVRHDPGQTAITAPPVSAGPYPAMAEATQLSSISVETPMPKPRKRARLGVAAAAAGVVLTIGVGAWVATRRSAKSSTAITSASVSVASARPAPVSPVENAATREAVVTPPPPASSTAAVDSVPSAASTPTRDAGAATRPGVKKRPLYGRD